LGGLIINGSGHGQAFGLLKSSNSLTRFVVHHTRSSRIMPFRLKRLLYLFDV
jgi:hypothetical protein